MKKTITNLIIITLISTTVVCADNLQLKEKLDKITKNDPRNEGIEAIAYTQKNGSILVFSIKNISPDKSQADVFRFFLQFSEVMKDYNFEIVKLACRKQEKFFIKGGYFKILGEEYSSQNPVYTIRTFPENVFNIDGTKAYESWVGGLIGVVKKQMEDFNDLNKKWYLDDFIKEMIKEKK